MIILIVLHNEIPSFNNNYVKNIINNYLKTG